MTKRKTAKQKDLEKEIQQVLEQFEFDDETRRKIFSLVLEVAQEKVQKPQKKKEGSQNDQR
mgnify:CR=1 FL=1|jgi:hypothetical protein|tara:strand:+ start:267 stop:449 length:183 start_codon:yes stop_codon:yes gene_type:complete